MLYVVHSSKTRRTTGRMRRTSQKTGRFEKGTMIKCELCGGETRIVNTRRSKTNDTTTRLIHCKECKHKYVLADGPRPGMDWRSKCLDYTPELWVRMRCKSCDHWWGGKCDKDQSPIRCTEYESSL